MKKLPVIFGILLLFASCEKENISRSFEDDPSIATLSGKWVVVSYQDYTYKNPTIWKDDVDSWNGMDVILTFTTDSLYGRNTTNSVSGNFTVSGRNIHIIRYGGTKLGQPEWGNMFSDVVYRFQRFEINRYQLRLYYNDNKNSVNLEPKKR